MFYEGPLQDGIALAVRESKLVVCFVRDDTHESSEWEDEYFADEEIIQLLKDKAVILRLREGTQEAGFLSSFCPISKYPTVVVIKNGMLNEYMVAGTSKVDFQNRLKGVLIGNPQTAISAPASLVSNTGNSATSAPQPTQPAQSAQPAAQEPKTTSRSEKQTDTRPTDPHKKPGHKVSSEQAERRAQRHREERERASKQAKQDQEQTKGKEAQPKATSSATPNETTTPPVERPQPRAATQYRLQIRLFDGSSVRSSFSPTDTIRAHVRPWLEEKRTDGDRPYTLKHILTPLPNHTISVSEEEQTLQELGLGPTANLVMVPVQTYTEAYASVASLPARGLYAGYNLVSGAVGAVTGTIGSILGYGGGQTPASNDSNVAPPTQSQRPGNSAARPRNGVGINVRTLRDQRDERGDSQFYNGNQLNFEPRRDNDRR
ncbi:predicted protein [Paecilomyces variotii No. 5]|uniref:UBX domain-containing protein 2 n=1 Tax=Byssochlamys spectabilis (strain No. 5 / NBRC 109023) TaxID=1356009 RepID=V5FUC4_BYSSN|nr:predicted protein [Paecilomyces variotii No. 5]